MDQRTKYGVNETRFLPINITVNNEENSFFQAPAEAIFVENNYVISCLSKIITLLGST